MNCFLNVVHNAHIHFERLAPKPDISRCIRSVCDVGWIFVPRFKILGQCVLPPPPPPALRHTEIGLFLVPYFFSILLKTCGRRQVHGSRTDSGAKDHRADNPTDILCIRVFFSCRRCCQHRPKKGHLNSCVLRISNGITKVNLAEINEA